MLSPTEAPAWYETSSMTDPADNLIAAPSDNATHSELSGDRLATRGGTSPRPRRAMRPAVSRFRLTFSKGSALRYIGHLDLVRAWERALRRASLPVAWTHGYTPRIRLSFAAPLALGAVGERELADVFLNERVDVDDLRVRLGAQLPGSCDLLDAVELPVGAPSLPSQVAWAWYEVSALRRSIAAPVVPPVDVVAGSRWSRRVPDEATLLAPPQLDHSDVPAGEPEVNDGAFGDGELDGASAETALRGSDAWLPAERLIADPSSRGRAQDEGPLRPASEWLTPEDPDPAPPADAEVSERLQLFLAATTCVVGRRRGEGQATSVDARGAVITARLLALGDRQGSPAWFNDDRRADLAPRIALVVRHDALGAGRPEDVVAALGYDARWVLRRAIGLEGESHPYP